jgi:8-oxo-dGTP diphosphatase
MTFMNGEPAVVLVRRREDPYRGFWALPGGFKTPTESLDDAARRELLEETGISYAEQLVQFGAYGDPGRDPRSNVVTVAYAIPTSPASLTNLRAGGDAADAAVIPVAAIHNDTVALAFDHRRILDDALDAFAVRLEHSGIAPRFLDEPFTMTELRRVYEKLWGEELSPANFRRSLEPKPTHGRDSDSTGSSSLKLALRQGLARSAAEGDPPALSLDDMPLLARRISDEQLRGIVEASLPDAEGDDQEQGTTNPWASLVASRQNPLDAERIAWTSLDPASLPYLVPAGEPDQEPRKYRATAAWDQAIPPIRRPRRRT